MRRKRPQAFAIRARTRDPALADWAAAEAWEAGAAGVEEKDPPRAGPDADAEGLAEGHAEGRGAEDGEAGIFGLVIYADAGAVQAVHEAVGRIEGVELGEPQALEDTDWSQEWRRGMRPVVVGERLVVRPSWIDPSEAPAELQLVIDPGQAFGTGAHVSTYLVLEWLEALSRRPGGLGENARVLDVGTGTGVLALAALALGAGRAIGFDLDLESGPAARHWALHNGLADRFDAFVGPIDALTRSGFDWLLANLLKREMLPIAPAMAAHMRQGGQAVLSGLLARERDEVLAAFEAVGFVAGEERRAVDANGDEWISLLITRA